VADRRLSIGLSARHGSGCRIRHPTEPVPGTQSHLEALEVVAREHGLAEEIQVIGEVSQLHPASEDIRRQPFDEIVNLLAIASRQAVDGLDDLLREAFLAQSSRFRWVLQG